MREKISLPLVHFPQAAVAGAAIPASAPLSQSAPLPQAALLADALPRALPRRRPADLPLLTRLAFLGRPGVGMLGLVLLFGGVGLAGMAQNGGYDAFIAREGQPWNIAARVVGFDIAAVTITGQSRMTETELLRAAGVDARDSLPFLDAAHVRDRLLAVPLVKTARVMKLYPNRLVIAIEERRPHALWQQNGRVLVVSEDGVAIDELRDERYLGLPFVVGEGAHQRLPEFLQLLAGLGDLAPRVKAGVLVSGRRWDLDMTNGMLVKLPEENPGRAVVTLARLQREARILDKDAMSIDLRAQDRVAVRLTEEGAAAREAALPHKTKKTGG